MNECKEECQRWRTAAVLAANCYSVPECKGGFTPESFLSAMREANAKLVNEINQFREEARKLLTEIPHSPESEWHTFLFRRDQFLRRFA